MTDGRKGTLEGHLRNVRIRTTLDVLLRQVAIVLAVGGVGAAIAIATERIFAFQVVSPFTAILAGAVAVFLVAGLAVLRSPSRMQVAVLIDDRLGAKERFSTALALAKSDDPFALAAEAEAHKAAKRLNLRGRFPVRPTRHWFGPAATWAIAAAVFLFVPSLDVLGTKALRAEQNQKAAKLAEAKAEVNKAVTSVKTAVEQAKAPPLTTDLEKLNDILAGDKPGEVGRQALKPLTDLAEKLKDIQKGQKNGGLGDMKKQLKDLRGTPDAYDDKLNQAIANGDFAGAAKMLKKALEDLNSGKLSAEDKAKLAKQLSDLSGQVAKVGDPQSQAEKMLERQGMDSKTASEMASMSEKDLRDALKKQGMSDEQVQELMDRLSQCKNGASKCNDLAKKLGNCQMSDQLNPDGLVALSDALSDLDGEQVGEMAIEDALNDLQGAIARLGDGNGGQPGQNGEGFILDENGNGEGLWIEGQNNGQAAMAGRGGLGRGYGKRPTGDPEDTSLTGTGVRNKPNKETEIIGSWLVRGATVTGESKRKLTTAVQASRDAAAEAIRDNKIPRKYEGPMKKYFGGMEKVAGGDANQP